MNVEEKERLIKKDIKSIENRVRSAFNQGYEMGLREGHLKNLNTCGDAVSRQVVISTIYDDKSDFKNDFAQGFFADKIRDLPSVSPQQRTGRWIEHDFEQLRKMGYYRCSECNIGYQRYERGERKSELPNINGQKYELHRIDNYCPNCGAKMVVEDK
jgi:rubredoxin